MGEPQAHTVNAGLPSQCAVAVQAKSMVPQVDTARRKPLGKKLGHSATAPRGARLVSVDQAAAYLGVSRRAVWRLIAAGTLARVALPGQRRVLLDVHDLAALVEQSKEPALRSTNNRSEEHTSELQSLRHLVCRLLLE